MIIKTKINEEPKLVEVSLDDIDNEPFLDGIWDLDGQELALSNEEEEQVLSDAIEELVSRRYDLAIERWEDEHEGRNELHRSD